MEFSGSNLRYNHSCDACPQSGMFSRHAHHQYEFLYFISGDAHCVIERRRHHLKTGELVVIPPLYYHFMDIGKPLPYERAVLNFSRCEARQEVLEQVFREPRILDLTAEPELQQLFGRFDRYLAEYDPEDRELLAEHLLTELVYLLSRKEGTEKDFSVYYNETINAAVQYIERHLTEIRQAEEICAALYISRSHLYHCFQKAFGIPPMKYIAEKRLLLAAARIKVGEKPAQAAAACGFGDYSSFFRAYKKRFGQAPGRGPEQ